MLKHMDRPSHLENNTDEQKTLFKYCVVDKFIILFSCPCMFRISSLICPSQKTSYHVRCAV